MKISITFNTSLVSWVSHAIGALTHDFVCEDRFETGAEELR
jgi:hypothetical protein